MTWNCRPSSLLALEDEYAAYCLDEGVAYFGNQIEGELNKVEGKTVAETVAMRERLLIKLLKGQSPYAEPPMDKVKVVKASD